MWRTGRAPVSSVGEAESDPEGLGPTMLLIHQGNRVEEGYQPRGSPCRTVTPGIIPFPEPQRDIDSLQYTEPQLLLLVYCATLAHYEIL